MASLGQTLLKSGRINLIQLNLALDFRVFYGGRLGTNLLELGIVDENILTEALAEHFGLPPAFAKDFENIPRDVIQEVPRGVAYRCQVVPFRKSREHLFVVVRDPLNEEVVNQIRNFTSLPLMIYTASEFRIQMALEENYQIRMEPRMYNIAAKLKGRRPPPADQLAGGRWTHPESEVAAVRQTIRSDIEAAVSAPAAGEQQTPPQESSAEKVTLSIHKLSLMLDNAATRDEIADLILQFAQKYLQRVALFVLRNEIGFGWDGRGPGFSRDRVKSIVFPLGEPSIFQTVVESQGHFLGTVPDTPVNKRFFTTLDGAQPKNVLLLPLTIGGITFGVVYGDNGDQNVVSDGINELQVMVSRANIAFERLIIAERQKALQHHASL